LVAALCNRRPCRAEQTTGFYINSFATWMSEHLTILAIDSAPWWAPVIQTAVGALIALAASVVVPLITDQVKRGADRQAVAGLLAGELSSYAFIIRERGYLAQLDRVMRDEQIPYYFEFSEGGLIYQKQMDRLGLLPPQICEKVIQAYNLVFAALVNAKTLQSMKAEYDKPANDLTKIRYDKLAWLQTYRGLSNFLSEFLEKADEVIPRLQEIARESTY
jgi:hypothetical protein